MLTRRTFLKSAVALTATTTLFWRGDTLYARANRSGAAIAMAQIPGGTLDPLGVPKFQTPLLVPPVMPKAGTIKQQGGKNIDYYEISVKQFAQQILPAGLPLTTVWGYGAVVSASRAFDEAMTMLICWATRR